MTTPIPPTSPEPLWPVTRLALGLLLRSLGLRLTRPLARLSPDLYDWHKDRWVRFAADCIHLQRRAKRIAAASE